MMKARRDGDIGPQFSLSSSEFPLGQRLPPATRRCSLAFDRLPMTVLPMPNGIRVRSPQSRTASPIAAPDIAGIEWIVDAVGCDPDRLRDLTVLRHVCETIVADLGLTAVGQPQWHQFPAPGGVTGLYLLCESHLACHTYPEFELATFNLYCCRQRPGWEWHDRLGEMLQADRVTVRTLTRGRSEDTDS
jgi:S-adenosylmethionine decarboxylase